MANRHPVDRLHFDGTSAPSVGRADTPLLLFIGQKSPATQTILIVSGKCVLTDEADRPLVQAFAEPCRLGQLQVNPYLGEQEQHSRTLTLPENISEMTFHPFR